MRQASLLQNQHHDFVKNNKNSVFELAVGMYRDGMDLAPESIARLILRFDENDFNTLHLLASIAMRTENFEDAVTGFYKCFDLQPELPIIRYDLTNSLFKAGNFNAALMHCEELLKINPGHLDTKSLYAAILVKVGKYLAAKEVYSSMLELLPNNAVLLLRLGVVNRILGLNSTAVDNFRHALALDPKLGEAYWNLANLKTFVFEEIDVNNMQELLNDDSLSQENISHLSFSLGKALEDRKQYSLAFSHYQKANAIYKNKHEYKAAENTSLVNRQITTFDQAYFENIRGINNSQQETPIFIVGLPRSGSTLLEQILASHSQVDATMELAEITAMARSLNRAENANEKRGYPEIVCKLTSEELSNFGEEYLKRTRLFRGNAMYFIDKTPHNFLHIGLIKSILPKAKIIDARREPMACGFSVYKQQFAQGHRFSNSLSDIGKYYKDYLRIMDHWHSVLPGEILTVNYENVISDFENQVKAILAFCDLDFEAECLEFYNSKRAVATVSSEQVRQPIYTSALEQWRNFEKELSPLKKALEE